MMYAGAQQLAAAQLLADARPRRAQFLAVHREELRRLREEIRREMDPEHRPYFTEQRLVQSTFEQQVNLMQPGDWATRFSDWLLLVGI